MCHLHIVITTYIYRRKILKAVKLNGPFLCMLHHYSRCDITRKLSVQETCDCPIASALKFCFETHESIWLWFLLGHRTF